LVQAVEEINQENAHLKEQKDLAVRESKAICQEMEEVKRECEELEIEIARKNTQQAAAREEAAALKKTATDLKDQVATAVWALQEADAEEEKLRIQVVTSPDRRKSELLVRKERLRKVKEECNNLEKAVQDCKTKVVNAMQALQDLATTKTVLDDLQEEAGRHTELVRRNDETRKRFQANEKKTGEVLTMIVEATRQLARVEEKIEHQRKQHILHIDAAQEALDKAKLQLHRVEKDRREVMARIAAGEAEVRSIEAAINDELAKTDFEIQTVVAQYKTVETVYLKRNQERMDALQEQHPNHSK
jgi:chromosome segregation ATPase